MPNDAAKPQATTQLAALAALAQEAYNNDQFEDAAAALQEIIKLGNQEGLPPDSIVHADLASSFLALGQLEKAWENWDQAVAIAEEREDDLALAHARSGMGYAYQGNRELDKAIVAFRSAMTSFEKAGSSDSVFDMQACIAGAQYVSGDLGAACDSYLQAWQWVKTPQTFGGLPAVSFSRLLQVLNNLGSLLIERRESKKAMEVLDEADRLFPPEYVDTPLETSLRYNRGLALFAQGRMEEARCDLQKAMEGYLRVGDVQRLAETINLLCHLCQCQNDVSAAIGFSELLIQLEKEHRFQANLSHTKVDNHPHGLWLGPHSNGASSSQVAIGDVSGQFRSNFLSHKGKAERGPLVIFAPAVRGFSGPLFPRGAASLASFLNDRGIPTLVVPLSQWIDHTEGAAAAHAQLHHVVNDVLSSLEPRAIGISIPFSFLYPDALEIAAAIREKEESVPVPIVVGGPHVTYWDTQCLEESPHVDIVVRREGEWAALELMRTLERGGDLGAVDGLTWRDENGTIHRNRGRQLGNILELPPIDFQVLPREFCEQMDIFGLVSRGCRFRCQFCQEYKFWRGQVRYHPVDRILDEMKTLESEFDNRYLTIDDSMLDMGSPFFLEFCGRLEKSSLSRPSGLLTRLDTINQEGLRAMKRASIPVLKVGVESGSERVLEKMKKGISPAQMVDSLELVHREGLETHAFMMVGHPGDNAAESEISRAFIEDLLKRELVSRLDPATFTPYPGTPCFSHPQQHGVTILTMDWRLWCRANRPICQLDDFSACEISHAFLRLLEVESRYR